MELMELSCRVIETLEDYRVNLNKNLFLHSQELSLASA